MARTAAFCTALRCYSCRLGPLTSRRPGHTKVSEATVTPVEADSQPSPLVHKAKRHPLHEPSYAAFGQSFSGSKNGEVLEIPVGTDAGCCEMVSRHESTGTAIGSGSVHACLRYESICQPNRVNRGYRSGQARILPSLTFLESLVGILPLRFRKCRRTSTLFLSIADAAAVHCATRNAYLPETSGQRMAPFIIPSRNLCSAQFRLTLVLRRPRHGHCYTQERSLRR